jgi:hypothetical protein
VWGGHGVLSFSVGEERGGEEWGRKGGKGVGSKKHDLMVEHWNILF